MPISVECGSCRAVLDLPHGAGRRRILCPHCGDKLDVRAAADEPRAQAGDHDDPGDRADGPPSRPASVLASAGLLCGCTALCFASVPALSFLTKPLSILGLALVVAAWVRGAARREPLGRLTPFAAAVCLPVVLFAGSWQDLKQVVSRPSRVARERTLIVPAGTQGMEPFARAEKDDWVDITRGSVEHNGVRARVMSATFGYARLKVGTKEERTPAKRLLIGVRLTGERLVRLTNYESWADPTRETARHEPRLTDDRDRSYRRVSFGPNAQLAGSSGDTFLTPGKPINDLIVFEAPRPEEIQYLRLELPASAFGGSGTLRFQIPKSAIKAN